MKIKYDWLTCIHGHELRFGKCPECERAKDQYKSLAFQQKKEIVTKIPIRRGCKAQGGCFCDGSCKDIIGYREPIFPGETTLKKKGGGINK